MIPSQEQVTDDIRTFFPSLKNGGIYLDSAAKTLTCMPAIKAVTDYYFNTDANMGRGVYDSSVRATLDVEDARSAVASMINVSPDQLVLTCSTTNAINLVANGIQWNAGDRLVTTVLEHHSNFLPWLNLRKRGVNVDIVPADSNGFISADDISNSAKGARLVAFTHASNALGTLQDVTAISEAAKSAGAMVLIDGAQAVSHENVDVSILEPDAYAFSGHKCFGPSGTGALYLSTRLMEQLQPSLLGGGSATDSSPEGFILVNSPATAVFEPGTQSIADFIGFGAAAVFRASVDWVMISEITGNLTQKLIDGLLDIPGVIVFGSRDVKRKTPVVSFSVPGYTPHQTGMLLNKRRGIMVRSGLHCAPTLWKTLYGKPEGAVRVSMHAYSSVEEIEQLLTAVAELAVKA
jgi:cysteine desulfurase/selenocysteine lyase